MPLKEVVDDKHLAEDSHRIEHKEAVVPQEGCDCVAFEKIVEIAIDVGDRPKNYNCCEFQSVRLWLHEYQAHDQPAQNLEEGSHDTAL